MFRLLSAILHLGNVNIEESARGPESCYVDDRDPSLLIMCDLMGIEAKQLAKWLVNKKLVTMNETVIKQMTWDQVGGVSAVCCFFDCFSVQFGRDSRG